MPHLAALLVATLPPDGRSDSPIPDRATQRLVAPAGNALDAVQLPCEQMCMAG